MKTFKIRATEENLRFTRSFTPAYDGTKDAYLVGNATAKVEGAWIKFYTDNILNAYFASGQATKRGFLKEHGYLD